MTKRIRFPAFIELDDGGFLSVYDALQDPEMRPQLRRAALREAQKHLGEAKRMQQIVNLVDRTDRLARSGS